MSDAARSIRTLTGNLFAVPLIAICFGTQWSWNEEIEASTAQIVHDDRERAPATSPLLWLAEGSDLAQGVRLPPRSTARVSLPRALDGFSIELQANGNTSFRIEATRATGPPVLLWTALGAEDSAALITRRSPPLLLDNPSDTLEITPTIRRAPTAVSGLRLVTPRWSLPHALLAWLP